MTGARRILLGLAALLAAATPAWAVSNGDGDLVVTFEGGISPKKLPRSAPAPVSVRVAGGVHSASGEPDQLPQLQRISVAINRQGHLFSRGLPTCDPATIQPATQAAAREVCGGALIGRGNVVARVNLPPQPPFALRAKLLAFNGPTRHGHKLILAQVYARKPPGAFILTFRVERKGGNFGTVLTTTLPERARDWAYLTHFEMNLHRTYTYRGKRRSLVSASCSAPTGFHRAVFPFARATYSFADGRRLSLSQAATCRVGSD